MASKTRRIRKGTLKSGAEFHYVNRPIRPRGKAAKKLKPGRASPRAIKRSKKRQAKKSPRAAYPRASAKHSPKRPAA